MSFYYKILFKLSSNPEILIREVRSSRLINPYLERLCAEHWQKIIFKAKTHNKKIWDSEVYRWESYQWQKKKLIINLSIIPFSVRICMNEYKDIIEKLGLNYAPMGLYTSCFIISADNKLLFIKKSKNYFTNRKVAFVGGVLSKSEKILNSRRDLFETVENEVLEELEVDKSQIDRMNFDAAYITQNFNVCLIFTIYLKSTYQEIKKEFNGGKNSEASNIIGVDYNNYASFIKILPEKDLPKFIICGYK